MKKGNPKEYWDWDAEFSDAQRYQIGKAQEGWRRTKALMADDLEYCVKRNAKIVELREMGHTLAEIGEYVKVSGARVSQILVHYRRENR